MRGKGSWMRGLGMAVAVVMMVAATTTTCRGDACVALVRTGTGDDMCDPQRKGAACCAPTLSTVTVRGPWILWNTSPSVPEGLYLRTGDEVGVGVVVAACLPEEIATTAKQRGYLRPGSRCPGGVAPLLKRVAAVEGARVEQLDGGLVIDGAPWPGGSIEPHDSRGRPVPWRLAFPFEVKAGEVLLLGEHSGSFDGRYFGPVRLGSVLGVYETALIPSPSPAGGRREPETELKAVSGVGWGRPLPVSGEGRGEGLP